METLSNIRTNDILIKNRLMFRGSMVALVTPFYQGQVDTKALERLIEFHIKEGTNAIVVTGTTGEAATLTRTEKSIVIKTAVAKARERIPIIAGTAANGTENCIALTKMAMELGAHAALIMTPAYIKPTQEGLYQHYQQIAKAAAIPIILYNVPSRTACDLLPQTVKRLASISNVIGIKEANGKMERLHELLNHAGSLEIYSGDDLTAAEWLLAGAKGVISVTANVVPHLMAKLCDAALSKNNSHCAHLNSRLQTLHQLLFVETNPIPVKYALNALALISNELRLPLTSLSLEHQANLMQALTSLKLI